MIAVVAHKVVAVASEFFSQLVHYSFHVIFSEVCVSYVNALPVKCFFY